MSSIDERIVTMNFDNKQFEKEVAVSISSLDKLKQGLKLEEAGKSLMALEEAGRRFSLASIADSVHNISDAFSSFGIIGITVLQNLTNAAFNTAKSIAASLTITPITTGFSEYELKMNAVQTIMAGTGEKLEVVNKYLAELNEYSDQTIYSFSDMTSNIGKFTNAGISLHESVAAIKGVSNVAALAGANSNEAARAMYNFSQALSAGHVKLIDWKSIENANMATSKFKEQLMLTAYEMGSLKRATDGTYRTLEGTIVTTKNFNYTLEEQWLTSEALVGTLGKYTDLTTDLGKQATEAAQSVKTLSQLMGVLREAAQSGWATSWEIIVGDFQEAKSLFTDINIVVGGMIGASAKARNAMLLGWKELGGRVVLLEAFKNIFDAIIGVIKPISEAFKEIFPAATAAQLIRITKSFRTFTEYLKMGSRTSESFKQTFKGLFAILDIGVMAISALVKGAMEIVKFFIPAGEGITFVTGAIGVFITGIRDSLKATDLFNKIIASLGTLLEPVGKAINTVSYAVREFMESVIQTIDLTPIISAFETFISYLVGTVDSIKNLDSNAIGEFTDGVVTKLTPIKTAGDYIKEVFTNIVTALGDIMPLFKGITDGVKTAFNELVTNVTEGIKNFDYTIFYKIFAGGVIAAVIGGIVFAVTKFILWVKSFFDKAGKFTDSLIGILDGIKGVLDGVRGSLEAWQQSIKAGVIFKIATAVALLAAALFVLSTIDANKLVASLAAMSVLFAELFGSMAIFSKIAKSDGFDNMTKVTGSLIALSVAILILSFAVGNLGKLDFDVLVKGLIGVGALAATLAVSAKIMGDSSIDLIKGSIGMIFFATAINKLAKTVSTLGELDLVVMAKGLLIVGALMAELALVMRYGKFEKIGIKTGIGLTLIAYAIGLLTKSVEVLGTMEPDKAIKGMMALGIILVELALFSEILQKSSTNMVQAAIGLTIIAGALYIIIGIIQTLAGMPTQALGIGMLAMATALGIIAIAMINMETALPGAQALIIVAAALLILLPVITTLSKIPFDQLVVGLLGLAGMMAIIAVTLSALAPLAPVIVALSHGILMFGLACMAVGAGIMMFAFGLGTLVGIAAASMDSLKLVVATLAQLIPFFMQKVAEGLISFAQKIAEGAPIIAQSIVTVVQAVIQMIFTVLPEVTLALSTFLVTLLNQLADAVPQMVDAGMRLILGILEGVLSNIFKVIAAAVKIVTEFLNGVASKLPDIIQSAFNVIIQFINGLADAIRNNHNKIYDAVGNLISAIVEAMVSLWFKLLRSGNDVVANIITGIKDMGGKLWTSMVDIGTNIINGMVSGVNNMAGNLFDSAMNVVRNAIDGVKKFLGIKSPSRLAMGLGEYFDQGFINGLQNLSGKVAKASIGVGSSAVDGVKSAISNIIDMIDTDADYNPTITPVIDMQYVDAGLSDMDKKLAMDRKIRIDTSNEKARSISKQVQANKVNERRVTSTNDAPSNPTYVFNQTNNSPKALTRLEIYRQTRNQFAALKGLVEAK